MFEMLIEVYALSSRTSRRFDMKVDRRKYKSFLYHVLLLTTERVLTQSRARHASKCPSNVLR